MRYYQPNHVPQRPGIGAIIPLSSFAGNLVQHRGREGNFFVKLICRKGTWKISDDPNPDSSGLICFLREKLGTNAYRLKITGHGQSFVFGEEAKK